MIYTKSYVDNVKNIPENSIFIYLKTLLLNKDRTFFLQQQQESKVNEHWNANYIIVKLEKTVPTCSKNKASSSLYFKKKIQKSDP